MIRPTTVHPHQNHIGACDMNDILEFIDDLKMLDALQGVYREAHIEDLLSKYTQRFEDMEAEFEKQANFDFAA